MRRGPRAWNEWRARNPSTSPNLTGIVLSVGERQMGPINGGPINLSAARLRHAFLRFATLSSANMEWADLSDADLSEARLNGASLAGADLTGALLDHADFTDARLTGTNLCGASLLAARNLTQAQLDEAIGDADVKLPAHLERPQSWTNNQIEPVAQSRSGYAARGLEPPAASRVGDRVSWLVGGPRARAEADPAAS